MNAFTIAGLIGLGVILFGLIFAGLMIWLSRLVTTNQAVLEKEQTAYNPAVTFGHKIPMQASKEEQIKEARKEAARRAAATPRWANMRIGGPEPSTKKPASKALEEDPITAVRIAAFHTWNGARTGMPVGGAPQASTAVATAPVAAPTKKPEDLVPGKDYAFIEISDDMDPAEVRKARIANAKAKSAAIKALKEAPAAAPAGQPVAAGVAAQPAAAPAVSVPKPDLIEITDDMSPDEVRKARITNAKAEAAYKKALKEAEAAAPAPAAAPAAQPVAQPAAVPVVSVPKPDLIEITDDMAPDEVRKARIANAKAEAAYKKALKEAGVDPAAPQPAAAAPAPAAETAPATTPAGAQDGAAGGDAAVLASIPKPDLVEITDDMDPAEVRTARINNAKALSAYKKALKEAGIDPATVEV